MNAHTKARRRRPPNEEQEIARLQSALAMRFLLIFAIPLFVIMVLGWYSYRLSGRVQALEALQQISVVERIMQNSHSHEWAIQSYQKLIKGYQEPQVAVRLAALYFERNKPGDRRQAIDMLEHAKASHPEYWEIYSTLTFIYLQEQHEEKAVEAGEKALTLNPYDAQTLNNLAWLYTTSKNEKIVNLGKAEAYAQKAVEYTRHLEPQYLDTLAEVYMRSRNVDRAAEVLKKAIDVKQGDGKYFESRLHQLQTQAKGPKSVRGSNGRKGQEIAATDR